MKWTTDQKRVIDTRDENILVAAAAGSGKTAVLVGRILALLLDEEHPTDIDRLLVVTFTRAAAAQMKERIRAALDARLDADPDNERLARQLSLIGNARITTIDGFCSYVCRSYGPEIALEAGFRIAEEGEAKLLRMDTLQKLFDASHEEKRPEFVQFMDTFAPDKNTSFPGEMILTLYNTAYSLPDPEGWLASCTASYETASADEWLASPMMQGLFSRAEETISRGILLARENLALTARPDGPSAYRPNAEAEYNVFCELASLMRREHTEDGDGDSSSLPLPYDEIRTLLTDFHSPTLSRKRPEAGEDPVLRDIFKDRRDQLLNIIKELKNTYFPYSAQTAFSIHCAAAGPLRELTRLTQEFAVKFAEAKREKNLLDYTDLEQLALRILRDRDGAPTRAAKELAGRFDHVMIDEYQDSNYLQEALLTAVAGAGTEKRNYFMVGDVKQSIYRFRSARPELFTEKYDSYRKADAAPEGLAPEENPGTPKAVPTSAEGAFSAQDGVRIDLHANFRSRREVIDAVNAIFSQIMIREVGGIDYDEDAALICGADYPEDPETDFTTECMLVLSEEEESDGGETENGKELEARAIGRRILQMVGREKITDDATGAFRPVEFRDIVILLRSMAGWSETFTRVLSSMHIPVHATMKSGYFTAPEVQETLNFLAILDNPRQDIPLASVLHSEYGGFSSEDLAKIRIFSNEKEDGKTVSFRDCVWTYAEEGPETGLRDRLARFLAFYEELREAAPETPIHILLDRLLSESGYLDYVSAMPGGTQRRANLEMLIEKAAEYEATSYTGLYHFIRYINNLQKYEVDFGEAGTIGEGENTVRILSIHKSKGLEFPVVFTAGMHKRFNRTDLNRSVLVHPVYGIASDYTDTVRRTKTKTLEKTAIAGFLGTESTGEELRVLYVAMTRAKQKLILSGLLKNADALETYRLFIPDSDPVLPSGHIMRAISFWSVFLPAALRSDKIRFCEVTPSMLMADEFGTQLGEARFYTQLLAADTTSVSDPALHELLTKRFSYRYQHEAITGMPVKVSVSELKAAHYYDEESLQLYEAPPVIPLIPQFMQEKAEELTGAGRGTVYHKVMELLDYRALPDSEETDALARAVTGQVEGFRASGRLLPEEADVVESTDIARFLQSGIGRRMRAAAISGTLRREQPFTFAVPADTVDPAYPAQESILVQGVIDAYFYEGDSIILVDYKTDKVSAPEELVRKYKIQLDSYADALAKLTGAAVPERYIYSFRLHTEIRV